DRTSTHCTISSHLVSFTHSSTPHIYPLSLHDALPIFEDQKSAVRSLADLLKPTSASHVAPRTKQVFGKLRPILLEEIGKAADPRSEEHTSELQSHLNLVCRLLLEKKKQ